MVELITLYPIYSTSFYHFTSNDHTFYTTIETFFLTKNYISN